MLNLRKRITLSLEINPVTTQDISDAVAGNKENQDKIVNQVVRLVKGAINSIRNVPEDLKADFEQDELMKILGQQGRVLQMFDDKKGSFSTFIYNVIINDWRMLYKKLLREHKQTVSLDQPIGTSKGETFSLGDVTPDPTSLQFLDDLRGHEALLNIILDALSEREGTVLNAWIESDEKGPKRNQEVADKFNKIYPENPLAPVTVEQMMIRVIRPKIYKMFVKPEKEEISEKSETELLKDRMRELDNLIKLTQEPSQSEVKTEVSKEEGPAAHEEVSEEEIQKSLLSPEGRARIYPAPVYKIDPQTGEKIRISSREVPITRMKILNMILKKLSRKNR